MHDLAVLEDQLVETFLRNGDPGEHGSSYSGQLAHVIRNVVDVLADDAHVGVLDIQALKQLLNSEFSFFFKLHEYFLVLFLPSPQSFDSVPQVLQALFALETAFDAVTDLFQFPLH